LPGVRGVGGWGDGAQVGWPCAGGGGEARGGLGCGGLATRRAGSGDRRDGGAAVAGDARSRGVTGLLPGVGGLGAVFGRLRRVAGGGGWRWCGPRPSRRLAGAQGRSPARKPACRGSSRVSPNRFCNWRSRYRAVCGWMCNWRATALALPAVLQPGQQGLRKHVPAGPGEDPAGGTRRVRAHRPGQFPRPRKITSVVELVGTADSRRRVTRRSRAEPRARGPGGPSAAKRLARASGNRGGRSPRSSRAGPARSSAPGPGPSGSGTSQARDVAGGYP